MNLTLDRFADNPIIDELVFWPPKPARIISIRASNVLFRKPFIEVLYENGETYHRHFPRAGFAQFWAEACVILDTITPIGLISEFEFPPHADRDGLVEKVLTTRTQCIAESGQMFEQGMYAQFLMQYGADCKDLPRQCQRRLALAQRELGRPR